MARVKKELVELLSTLSASEIEKLRAQLVGPKLQALKRERQKLEKRLKEIDAEMARLGARKPARRAARRRGPRPGTLASKIRNILEKAGRPMRVKEICDALAAAGAARTKTFANYVNRTLSTNPLFSKAGRGVYKLSPEGGGRTVAKAPKKKSPKAAVRRKAAARKKAAKKA